MSSERRTTHRRILASPKPVLFQKVDACMRLPRVSRCTFGRGVVVGLLLAFLSRAKERARKGAHAQKEHARARKGARPRPQRSMRAFLWVSKEAQMTHGERRSPPSSRDWPPGASAPPLGAPRAQSHEPNGA